MYYYGEGVTQDYAKAAEWFKYSADKVSNRTKKDTYGTPEYNPVMLGSLKNKSKDTYGITEYNPIMLGFLKSKSDAKFLNSYINHLSGPNGEKIKYRRVGTCCAFKTPRGLFEETGVLEVWEVTYNGLSNPTKLYFNVYDYGKFSAPVGFLIIK